MFFRGTSTRKTFEVLPESCSTANLLRPINVCPHPPDALLCSRLLSAHMQYAHECVEGLKEVPYRRLAGGVHDVISVQP